MDWSSVSTIASSLATAFDITRSMSGIRDQALVNEKVAALNDILLKTQEQLLAHNAMLLQLLQEKFETSEKLRELSEAASQRGRYSLVEVDSGQFAYRVNVAPQQGGTAEPSHAEPDHYICQRCFDDGIKVVLQRLAVSVGSTALCCPGCNLRIGHTSAPVAAGQSSTQQRTISTGFPRDW